MKKRTTVLFRLSFMASRRSNSKGDRTRQEIVRLAADLATASGLEGLTVGSLAKSLGMSKSGLFAHFGSKEELQLAVVDTARNIFVARVIRPAYGEPGLRSEEP